MEKEMKDVEAKEEGMDIAIFPGMDFPEEIRTLFTEYTETLLKGDPSFQEYLHLQHYEEELNHLERKYGGKTGRLYIVFFKGKTAGCVGLRRIDALRCEMKRLYVRPVFQGKGIGRRLVDRIIEEARTIGYRQMLLDTLPFLQSAIRLYRTYGFYEIPRYNDSPMQRAVYMRLDL